MGTTSRELGCYVVGVHLFGKDHDGKKLKLNVDIMIDNADQSLGDKIVHLAETQSTVERVIEDEVKVCEPNLLNSYSVNGSNDANLHNIKIHLMDRLQEELDLELDQNVSIVLVPDWSK